MGHEPLRICHLICRWRQIHSSVDDFSFDFLQKYKESVFDEFVSDVKQKQRMQDVIDEVKLTKLYPWYEVLGNRIQILCDQLSKPDLDELGVVHTFTNEMLHYLHFSTHHVAGSGLILDLNDLLFVHTVLLDVFIWLNNNRVCCLQSSFSFHNFDFYENFCHFVHFQE